MTYSHFIFVLLSCISLSSYAMHQDPNPQNWAIDGRFVTRSCALILPIEAKQIFINVTLLAPETANSEHAKRQYFISHQQETRTMVQKVLVAYQQQMQKERELARDPNTASTQLELLKVNVTEFDFNPDLALLIARKQWGKQKLSENVTAILEERVACLYDAQKGTLQTSPYALQITEDGQKPMLVSMNVLRERYPHEETLFIRPETRKAITIESHERALQLGMQALVNGCFNMRPNPHAYFDSLFIQDLRALAGNYLALLKQAHNAEN